MTMTTMAGATAATSSSSSSSSSRSSVSSLSTSSSSSSYPFLPCGGAGAGSGGLSLPPLRLSAPRPGLWALQALAVDAAGNEGAAVACALSFEKGAASGADLLLSPVAIAAIAVAALVVVVALGVGLVACRGRR